MKHPGVFFRDKTLSRITMEEDVNNVCARTKLVEASGTHHNHVDAVLAKAAVSNRLSPAAIVQQV